MLELLVLRRKADALSSFVDILAFFENWEERDRYFTADQLGRDETCCAEDNYSDMNNIYAK